MKLGHCSILDLMVHHQRSPKYQRIWKFSFLKYYVITRDTWIDPKRLWQFPSDHVILFESKSIKADLCYQIYANSPCASSYTIKVSRTGHLNFEIFKVGHIDVGIFAWSPEPVHIISRKHRLFDNWVHVIVVLGISHCFPANSLHRTMFT